MDCSKLHDSVMNNIESILASLYGVEYMEYAMRPEYSEASYYLYKFFQEVASINKEKEV